MTGPETPSVTETASEVGRLKRRLERERTIRREAEAIAEKGLRDLYQRQRQLELLEVIAAASNQSVTVHEVLEFAIEQFCDFGKWTFGHAFLVDNSVLCSANVWHVSDPAMVARFQSATAIAQFARGVGLPGAALAAAKPIWIAELARDKNFPRLPFAGGAAMRSGFPYPVRYRSGWRSGILRA